MILLAYKPIFNLNKFVSNLGVKAFYQDNIILPCNCPGSGLIDKYHRCVVTADLQIVENNKSRKLSTKGPKYRENNYILWTKAKSIIIQGLNDCIDTWCSEYDIEKSVRTEQKGEVIDKVNEKIKALSNKTSSRFNKSVFQKKNPLNTSNDINNQFVVTPNR